MFGFEIFQAIYFNLGEDCRNKILGNIFGLVDVSVSDFVIKDDGANFKIFSKGLFYQYSFVLGVGKNIIERDDVIVRWKVFVNNDGMADLNEFIACLVQYQDEYHVYQLISRFL